MFSRLSSPSAMHCAATIEEVNVTTNHHDKRETQKHESCLVNVLKYVFRFLRNIGSNNGAKLYSSLYVEQITAEREQS